MSIHAVNWVFRNSRARGDQRLVLLAIADETDDEGFGAYVSQVTIARKSCCDKVTAIRCIERLEKMGELIVIRSGGGRGYPNEYIVMMGRDRAQLMETFRALKNKGLQNATVRKKGYRDGPGVPEKRLRNSGETVASRVHNPDPGFDSYNPPTPLNGTEERLRFLESLADQGPKDEPLKPDPQTATRVRKLREELQETG